MNGISFLVLSMLMKNKPSYVYTAQIEEVTLNRRYTYDEFAATAQAVAEECGDLVQMSSIGRSFDDRAILLFSVGRGPIRIIVTGGVHARETINPIVLLKVIEAYCNAYAENASISGYSVRSILDMVTIDFVPLVNPDGYALVVEGPEAITNPELNSFITAYENQINNWKANARGVDINRNFPSSLWGGGNVNTYGPADYPGPFPASERETLALLDLFDQQNFYGYLDFHSRGDGIYYYRGLKDQEYNRLQRELADIFAGLSGYVPLMSDPAPVPDGTWGNTVDYVSETMDKPGFTIETVNDSAAFPLQVYLQEPTYYSILPLPLALAQRAIQLEAENYYPYKVYVNGAFLKDFRSLEAAREFAARYDNSEIRS